MNTDELKNGTALTTPQIPAGNPEVIRQAQHLLSLVQSGQVAGFAAVAIGPDGGVSHMVAIPSSPSMCQLAIGGLHVLIDNLVTGVKQMQQQANVGRILKPPMMGRHG